MREPHDEFVGQTAIITGAANGIGLAIAKRFAAEGANVVIADIDESAGAMAAEEMTAAGRRAMFVKCDVGNAADVDRVVDTAVETFGGIDILVNNAGDVVTSKHFLEGDEKWWDDMIRVNLKGHFLFIKKVAPVMVQAQHGAIINMSSGGANRSHRGAVGYDASKGGIEAMTRSLALDLRRTGSASTRSFRASSRAGRNTLPTAPKSCATRPFRSVAEVTQRTSQVRRSSWHRKTPSM
jgi:3-oxoacyl-[acyl-carrier protein] reductase